MIRPLDLPALSFRQRPTVARPVFSSRTPQSVLNADEFQKTPALRFGAAAPYYGYPKILLNRIDEMMAEHASRLGPGGPELQRLNELRIKLMERAKSLGLNPLDTNFYVVPEERFFDVISKEGYEDRFDHWIFGREYNEARRPYSYAGNRFFMANTMGGDVLQSYLLDANYPEMQKAVMAHTLALADLYKNNIHYKSLQTFSPDMFADHAERIKDYTQDPEIGFDKMEQFLEIAYSVRFLIPMYASKPRSLDGEAQASAANPDRDVLAYVIQNSKNLTPWEKDVLAMMRAESYHFTPKLRTQILADGWSAYMNEKLNAENPDMLEKDKIFQEAQFTAESFRGNKVKLNLRSLGYEIFRDIENRWDTGRFGPEYEAEQDMVKREDWDKKLGQGFSKALAVRRFSDDISFISEYLTPEVVERLNAYTYDPEKAKDQQEEGTKLHLTSREFLDIQNRLINMFVNGGKPSIAVIDGNYNNSGELLLEHYHDYDLKKDYAEKTLLNLEALWGKPVHIKTKLTDQEGNQKPVILSSINGVVKEQDLTQPVPDGSAIDRLKQYINDYYERK